MSIRANVDANALNERITIQRLTETQNATTGDLTSSWATLVTCWARVDGEKATDRFQEPLEADQIQSVRLFTIWIRANITQRYALRERDRISWRGRVLDVVEVRDQQLRGELTVLMCREGLTNG